MIEIKYLINTCKPLLLMFGLIAMLAACGGEKKVDEDLQKAFDTHLEAVKVRQTVKDQLEKLTASADSLFTATYKNDLVAIEQALKTWDEDLVEVPGFEHEHDHAEHEHDHDHSGHDHDHDHHHHDEGPELAPKQHLEVQQFLLKEIKAIAAQVNQLQNK